VTEIVEIPPGDERLGAVYPVMHELRDRLGEDEFRAIYEAGHPLGYRLAALFDEGECRAAAGYRLVTNFVSGLHLYVDDLVTGERWRSRGYGRMLNEYLVELAKLEGCTSVQLDSNVRRASAHRFYFRERYTIYAFHFVRTL
jgi:GNAT superfamily N-acetyltransferase